MNVTLLNVVNLMCFHILGMQTITILTHHYGVVYTEALWEITMADLPTIQRWCFFPSFSLWMYPACVYRPKHDNPVQSKYIYCYMLYDLALKRNKVYLLLLSYDMFAFSMCIFMTQTFVQTKVRKKDKDVYWCYTHETCITHNYSTSQKHF